MNTSKLDKLYFSQYALNTYRTCPLKFRHRYIDGLYWPRSWTTPEEKNRVEKGQLFHLLAQRYFNEIDSTVPQGAEHAGELRAWLGELQQFVPLNKKNNYYPEYLLRLNRNGIKLQAKYDLIMTTPEHRVVIYDWKTDTKPFQGPRLLRSMQTIIYLYLLLEAGSGIITEQPIKPEQVTMLYWNPLFPEKPFIIEYSGKKHSSFEEQLSVLLSSILSTPYEEFRPAPEKEYCGKCEYSPICHGVRGEATIDPEENEALLEADSAIDDQTFNFF